MKLPTLLRILAGAAIFLASMQVAASDMPPMPGLAWAFGALYGGSALAIVAGSVFLFRLDRAWDRTGSFAQAFVSNIGWFVATLVGLAPWVALFAMRFIDWVMKH